MTQSTGSSPAPTSGPSRRPPSKLRVPSSSRKASNPSLSLVYASPGSSMPPPAGSSSSGSRSEEALSRQLDGDLGGKQMGLRSRRSSSATIRTINTINGNGNGPQSPRESIMEEDEDSGPILERPITTNGGEDGGDQGGRGTRLNPKSSSSWLRWNSPTPSFPKSDKGKGKERERMVGDRTPRRASTIGGESLGRQSSRLSAQTSTRRDSFDTRLDVPGTISPESHTEAQPNPDTNPNPKPDVRGTEVVQTSVPAPSTTKVRGWFSRNPPPEPKPTTPIETSNSEPAQTSLSQTPVVDFNQPRLEGEIAPALDQSLETAHEDSAPNGSGPVAATKSDPTLADAKAPSDGLVGSKDQAVSSDDQSTRGWAGYLSWGRSKAPSPLAASTGPKTKPPSAQDLFKPDPTTATPDAGTVPANDTSVAGSGGSQQPNAIASASAPARHAAAPFDIETAGSDKLPQGETEVAGSATTATSHQSDNTETRVDSGPKSTWGNFLYSIVIPQTKDTSASERVQVASCEDETVKASSSTEEQPPTHIEPEAVSQPPNQDPSSIVTTDTPAQTDTAASEPLSTTQAGRKNSQASTTAGWLNYLAFRATQKKVTQPASVLTTDTNEEVMDLSTDPNFPIESTQISADKPTSITAGAAAKTKLGDGIAMKPPAAMLKRDKRPSNSSLRSAASVTPIPPSPRSQTKAESRTTTPAPSVKGPSSLPAPPQANSITQPNLVIPTFSATFDRPPRSFMPLVPEKPPAAIPQGGLAWRAFGAVGSYVYPGSTQETKPEVKVEGDPKETRGRKEGRRIGSNLPRRIGMDGGHVDDGWKNVKRVVVVGVHGWFPAKMLNSVIGEPTGTSSKFANMMGQAVRKFFDDKGVDDIRLTLIPLEGEGTIESRVDRLYKSYLSNPAWINDLRRADAVFFAAHSQGCIVTTHLLSRLIAQGHIKTPLNAEAVARCSWAFGPVSIVPPSEPRSPRSRLANTVPVNVEEGGYQKVCMLAMCGVHQGPLYSISTSTVIQPYLNWFENAAAKELFEFQDTTSAVSQAYQRALAMVLENDVRVVLLSSLNDQVVPIYGSSFSSATHPLLLRALFVDGTSYSASDFMTNLLCFAFMLRNAGISDERLIEHLSEATAGSLTGLGHSTPYEEPATFRLAVDYLFHAGPVRPTEPAAELQIEHFSVREGRNDYELPWIMRALVDSPEVKDLFPGELRDLKEGILHWKPTTKALRDIKKRLEPMAGRQSKLRPLTHSPSSASLNSTAETGASPGSKKQLAPPIGKGLKSKL